MALAASGSVVLSVPAQAAVNPVANPLLDEQCGIPVTLVLDASGSISSSNAVSTVRSAASVFLNALKDTGSTARVLDFGTVARQTAPATLVTTGSLAPGGVHANALQAYYNPIPPLQPGVTGHSWRGGSYPVNQTSSYTNSSSAQYTNWDQSLDQAGRQPSDLVVYVTDGDPTAVDSDQPGDPFYVAGQDPPNVRMNMSSGAGLQLALDRAVQEANQAKTDGARMLAIGVGEAVTQSASVQRLVQVAGPQVVTDASTVTSLNQVDVAVVPDFQDLASMLRRIVTALCSPSLTIRKLAQTPDSTEYQPAQGWDMTVTPTVSGGTYTWVQPGGAPVGPATVTTDSDGYSKFQWRPNPAAANTTAAVSETPQAGWTPQSAHCEVLHPDDSRTILDPPDPTSFTVPMGPEDIGTCTIRNSFDYAPGIHVEKTNAPTLVRGDLEPPAEVTSSYVVTNTGNTPLHGITVSDDTCGPVQATESGGHNVGDVDEDHALDLTEAWEFTCTQPIQESITDEPIEITNTVTVTGTDPAGTVVTDDDDADYEVVVPAIRVVKDVEGDGQGPQDSITVPVGTDVTYTYTVTNQGNVPLQDVSIEDDTPPCTSPSFVGGDTNGDDILDLDETWTYTCDAAPTASVTNVATVEGTPTRVTPAGPPVTDTDPATVNTIDPDLTLTKAVDQDLVFPDTDVTYTYVASNTGDVDLRNPADTGAPSVPPAPWVTDDHCSPVTYQSGDTDTDGLLSQGESWTFTCSATISTATTNTAEIDAITESPTPVHLVREATAFVDVATADIEIRKSALRGVVLDPAATPVAGPDTPTPRQAVYLYEVTNTGTLPLAGVAARVNDDTCSPLVAVVLRSDVNSNGLLDPGEVWRYLCATTLEQSDGFPSDGSVSALVTNTATAEGTPVLDGTPSPSHDVSDTDTAQVLVIKPSLTLTKSVSEDLVRPGESVTYTYLVRNTGDVGLTLIDGGDDMCPGVEYVSGDANGNGILDGSNSAAAETWRFRCSQQIDDPTTNTATVVGVDPLGNQYEATDTAFVDVLLSGINLDKEVSDELVLAGSTVTYTFTVTNTGTSPVPANDVLSDVSLGDVSNPGNPGCTTPAFTGGDTSGDDLLDRDETWTYTCTGVIDETTSDTGTVEGTDIKDGLVTSEDTATVTAFQPGISVEKTADPTEVERGGSVTYTYRVVNTGNVPLADVADRITDDTCSPVSYVSGDTDEDGQLDTSRDVFESGGDETWFFRCTTAIDEDTVNTVVVSGTPVQPDGTLLCDANGASTCDPTDTDQARVTVIEGGGVLPTETGRPLPGTGGHGLGLLWLGLGLLALGLVSLSVSRTRGRH